MKKNANKLLKNMFLATAALSAIIITGCNNNDYTERGESSTTTPSDSMTIHPDTSLHNDSMIMNADSGTEMIDNPNRTDSVTNLKTGKTPKKEN